MMRKLMQLLLKCHLIFLSTIFGLSCYLAQLTAILPSIRFFFLARFGKTSALKLTIVDNHNPEMLVSGDRGERANKKNTKTTKIVDINDNYNNFECNHRS